MKMCTRCGNEKPSNDFSDNPKSKDGKMAWCKECVRVYNKIRYKERITGRLSLEEREALQLESMRYVEERKATVKKEQEGDKRDDHDIMLKSLCLMSKAWSKMTKKEQSEWVDKWDDVKKKRAERHKR